MRRSRLDVVENVTEKFVKQPGIRAELSGKLGIGLTFSAARVVAFRWLQGLGLNQRPLGYECETAMTVTL